MLVQAEQVRVIMDKGKISSVMKTLLPDWAGTCKIEKRLIPDMPVTV